MERLIKYTVLFLLLSSYGMSMQGSKDADDPFALFKLPTQKATVHYVKRGGKEYIYLKGKGLKEYTVVNTEDGVTLNVKGHSIKGKASLSDKSAYVDNLKTESSDDGSKVDLKLKGNPGFKIYKRPSGLVLAMGPGYQEIAEDDLEVLDADVSSSSDIDAELDSLLKSGNGGVNQGKKAPAPAELDSLITSVNKDNTAKEAREQLAEKTGKDHIDKELDKILAEFDSDNAMGEQVEVQEGLGKPYTLQDIKVAKVDNKIRLTLKTNKPAKYEQKEAGSNKQVVVELTNAKLIKKFKKVNTKAGRGLVASVKTEQLKGPYKAVRVTINLNKELQPEISQNNNLLYLEFPTTICTTLEDKHVVKEAKPKIAGVRSTRSYDDMEAARQMSNVNFEDYLAKPTEFYGRRMSIQVSNANVLDVLRMIQEVSGINIVVSEKVKGTVDVSLKNVPWDQALSVVLQNAQLGYIRQGSVIRVAPLADLRDERRLAAEAMDAHNNLEPLKIMVARLNYVNSKEVEEKVTALLSRRGKISVDKDAKTLVVHDIEDVINKADKLLRAIDVKPMQVAIEANVIEANNSWIRAMGFSWATQSGDIAFKNVSGIGNIDAAIGAASVNGEVKIVSAPKISAIDRQMASILQGTQVAYRTTGQTANGESVNKIEFENIEVALNVTPRVTSNNEIILDIDVKREFPDYTTKTSKTMPPGVGVRKATSQIILKDGDTAVIGGLYSLDNGDSSAGVPLLKKIPVLGWFFGKSESREIRSEMLIFLKATIKKDNTDLAKK